MAPYSLVTVSNSLHLSFGAVTAYAQFTEHSHSFSIFLMSHLYWYVICVWAGEAVFRGCVHVPSDEPESEGVQSSVLFGLPVTALSLGSAGPPVGLGEGPGDFCLGHLGPVWSVRSGIWSLPCGELCSLPTSNFWGGNVGPLSMKMVGWIPGRVVPLCLQRNG